MDAILSLLLSDYAKGRRIDQPACPGRPSTEAVGQLLQLLQKLVFPGYFCGESSCAGQESCTGLLLHRTLYTLEGLIQPFCQEKTRDICREFLRQIPGIRQSMQLDLDAFLQGDPAADSPEEIIISYPGYYAIFVYRLANSLYRAGVPVLPRMMTELAHSRTGIDIHPGAAIGESFFIDHGTGIVIGQTTHISHHVKLYQGVTLGALSTRKGAALKNIKRHPTLESHVTVYAGATILGGDTVIGHGVTIGANAFVTASVAENPP